MKHAPEAIEITSFVYFTIILLLISLVLAILCLVGMTLLGLGNVATRYAKLTLTEHPPRKYQPHEHTVRDCRCALTHRRDCGGHLGGGEEWEA